jgi:hypothetical protein
VLENDVDPAIRSQMNVEVRSRFDTFFARVMGFDSLSVRRRANAQYDPPLVMGSPANNLGDVPPGSCTQLGFPPGGTSCVNVPGNAEQSLWLQIEAQGTLKRNGNAFTSAACGPQTDGCTNAGPAGNAEFDPARPGEYVSIVNDVAGAPLYVYVYDAAYVDTRDNSPGAPPAVVNSPCGKTLVNAPATYGDLAYCAGDQNLNGFGSDLLFDTRYEILAPDRTSSPTDNPPYGGCAPQTVPGENPQPPNAAVLGPAVAPYFQQWALMCAIPDGGPAGSEWILHVSAPNAGAKGANNFSVLALHGPGVIPSGNLRVFTRERLMLHAARETGGGLSTYFYLARVLPSSRARTLTLSFFDLGDNQGDTDATGKLRIVPKNASFPGGEPQDCKYTPPPGFSTSTWPGPPWGLFADAPDCTFAFDRATWNGQWVTVTVPIPPGYTCPTGPGATFQDCWIQLEITPDMVPRLADATTWTATMGGAPVRLVG